MRGIKAACLIVSPLNSLMDDTADRLNSLGLRSMRLTNASHNDGTANAFLGNFIIICTNWYLDKYLIEYLNIN